MALSIILELLQQQFTRVPPLQDRELDGQIVVVTGASSGLGLEMARKLAKMQPGQLILTGRTAEKLAKPLADIVAESGHRRIAAWPLDLESNDSIKSFVDRLHKQKDARLDLLILNAGTQLYHYQQSEGHETTMQVNVYSTFLLLALLHPLMSRTRKLRSAQWGPARCVIVGSDAHTFILKVPTDMNILEAADSEERATLAIHASEPSQQVLSMDSRYFLSKFVLMEAYQEAVKRLDGNDVTVTQANPGLCSTNLARRTEGFVNVIKPLIMFFLARSPDTGARCILHPALLDAAPSAVHGRYFSSSVDYPVAPYVRSAEGQKAAAGIYASLVRDLAKVDDRVVSVLK